MLLVVAGGVVVVVIATIAVVVFTRGPGAGNPAAGVTLPPGSTAEAAAWAETASLPAAALPQLAGPYQGGAKIGEGVRPPTNSWYSGTVFNGGGQPAFTGVLAFLPTGTGVTFGLPVPHVTTNTIFGSFPPDAALGLASDDYFVSASDALSATYTFTQNGAALGTLTAAEGWPYLAYTATTSQSVTLSEDLTPVAGGYTFTAGQTSYAAVSSTVPQASDGRSTFDLGAGASLIVFAVPNGASAKDLATLYSGAVPLTQTSVSYAVDGSRASTTYSLATGGGSTVFAGRPHQQFSTGDVLDATYPSIYGDLSLHSGSTFTFGVDAQEPSAALDLSGLTDSERSELTAQVTADSAVTFTAVDSYYGGKAVYRAAQLYSLATALGQTDAAARIKTALLAELALWFDPRGCVGRSVKCFVYDPVLGGVVGMQAAFGSDEFNDHHFHYGYFLYAAGVMAAADPTLVAKYQTIGDVLAADIASPAATSAFPLRRSFDDYTGFSWASGTSPFADGNNQESSSEAVNAWAGLTLWSTASGNAALHTEAQWMLSTEIATARAYWIDSPAPSGFDHGFVSLNWSGKRDYATFFSAEPSAILGIQLIPMSPSQGYLADDPARITALFDEAVPGDNLRLPLVDYTVMYLALADKPRALALAEKITPDFIDNGNSRSYLLAYIMSQTG